MGTNYYTKTKTCKECGHKQNGIHLGKSSAGWTFSFQYNGGRYYKNIKEMKEWLSDKEIENEYGESVSKEEFWNLVESKKNEPNNHALYMFKEYPNMDGEYIIDGHSFTDREFS